MTARDWLFAVIPWGVLCYFTLVAFWLRLKRSKAVNEAGPLLLRVIRLRVRLWLFASYFVGCMVFVPSWAIALIDGFSPRALTHTMTYTLMPIIVYLMMHAAAYVEARERGIVCNQAFWSWGHIQEYEWLDDRPTLRLRRARYDFTDFRIAESQRDALDHILRQSIGGVGKAEQDSPARDAKSA